MIRKNHHMKRVILLAAVLFALLSRAEASVPEVPAEISEGTSAMARDFNDRDYFLKIRKLITGAQKSIDIAAENFSISDSPQDPAARIVEDLIVSRKKGVRVRLFMNTFAEASDETSLFLRDDILYRMRREGIEIHFVNPRYRLYDRVMIIDGQDVLEGGLPWTRKDLEENLGAGLLLRSAQHAEQRRIRLEFLPLWDVEQHKNEMADGSVAVPLYLLRELRYFPSMVSHDDGDAMKIYLKLTRLFFQVQDVHLTASFEELSSEIPADGYFEKTAVQFQTVKALERLASEYNLIEIEKKSSDRFWIRMIFPSENEAVVRVPLPLFQENYVKELSPEALFAYFVILNRAQITGEAPVWLGSARNVEQDFPLSAHKFYAGTLELKKRNLIEIFPFKLQEGYKTAKSMEYRYLLNPILSMSERMEIYSRLRDQFGTDRLKEAQQMAEFLEEPEDPKVLAVYLDLMKHFKTEDILTFSERLSRLPSRGTPDRLTYLRTLLEHETQKDLSLAVA